MSIETDQNKADSGDTILNWSEAIRLNPSDWAVLILGLALFFVSALFLVFASVVAYGSLLGVAYYDSLLGNIYRLMLPSYDLLLYINIHGANMRLGLWGGILLITFCAVALFFVVKKLVGILAKLRGKSHSTRQSKADWALGLISVCFGLLLGINLFEILDLEYATNFGDSVGIGITFFMSLLQN